MKEVLKERTVYDTYYEAVDGTSFRSKEECEKYEESANGVLRSKFKNSIIKEGTEYSIFSVGSDESIVYAVKIETNADADTVKQLWIMSHTYIANTERYTKYLEEAFAKIDEAHTKGDILFVGEDCEGGIYIIDTRAHFMENIQNVGKEQDDLR